MSLKKRLNLGNKRKGRKYRQEKQQWQGLKRKKKKEKEMKSGRKLCEARKKIYYHKRKNTRGTERKCVKNTTKGNG